MIQIAPDFNFFDFEPNEDLRKKANLATQRLLDLAPYGSIVVAALKKKGELYKCSIDIYSSNGPFRTSAAHEDPKVSLESAARSISKKLDHWKGLRHLSGRLKRLNPLPSSA
ncbi:MAG: hypothetical protein AB7F66_14570 [Bacteriovoracia bacterium]